MRKGMLDFFLSRRTMNDKCYYYKQIPYDVNLSSLSAIEYDLENPYGFFYAKPVSSYDFSKNPIAGAFMFDASNITLQTNDDIEDLELNDVVVFRGKHYRVDNIQKTPFRNTNSFVEDIMYIYYLRLRG